MTSARTSATSAGCGNVRTPSYRTGRTTCSMRSTRRRAKTEMDACGSWRSSSAIAGWSCLPRRKRRTAPLSPRRRTGLALNRRPPGLPRPSHRQGLHLRLRRRQDGRNLNPLHRLRPSGRHRPLRHHQRTGRHRHEPHHQSSRRLVLVKTRPRQPKLRRSAGRRTGETQSLKSSTSRQPPEAEGRRARWGKH
jgi:hypothetical protein